jgi:hypothetical protein
MVNEIEGWMGIILLPVIVMLLIWLITHVPKWPPGK